ncbi:MAG: hypothetical protein HQL32_10945 [Planctomycetes bacterium]|nr:hypothetical protein [Planctomycetota bacterium]
MMKSFFYFFLVFAFSSLAFCQDDLHIKLKHDISIADFNKKQVTVKNVVIPKKKIKKTTYGVFRGSAGSVQKYLALKDKKVWSGISVTFSSDRLKEYTLNSSEKSSKSKAQTVMAQLIQMNGTDYDLFEKKIFGETSYVFQWDAKGVPASFIYRSSKGGDCFYQYSYNAKATKTARLKKVKPNQPKIAKLLKSDLGISGSDSSTTSGTDNVALDMEDSSSEGVDDLVDSLDLDF